jgi:hypothetical protein
VQTQGGAFAMFSSHVDVLPGKRRSFFPPFGRCVRVTGSTAGSNDMKGWAQVSWQCCLRTRRPAVGRPVESVVDEEMGGSAAHWPGGCAGTMPMPVSCRAERDVSQPPRGHVWGHDWAARYAIQVGWASALRYHYDRRHREWERARNDASTPSAIRLISGLPVVLSRVTERLHSVRCSSSSAELSVGVYPGTDFHSGRRLYRLFEAGGRSDGGHPTVRDQLQAGDSLSARPDTADHPIVQTVSRHYERVVRRSLRCANAIRLRR